MRKKKRAKRDETHPARTPAETIHREGYFLESLFIFLHFLRKFAAFFNCFTLSLALRQALPQRCNCSASAGLIF